MKNVKMPTSKNYQDFLIDNLKNPEEAAAYLEILLEEGTDDPRLLLQMLKNIMIAYSQSNKTSDLAKQHYEQLNQMFTKSNCAEILTFIKLLNELGFQIKMTVQDLD